MFCPRCGTENDDGNRFCVSCGAALAQKKKPARGAGGAPDASRGATEAPTDSTPGRLEEVIGTSRGARIATALTLVAIAVAVVAFIVLRSDDSEGEVQQDAYLTSLDRQCVQEKARISELEASTLNQESPDFGTFVNFLVRDVTEWHSGLQSTPPPAAHVEGVRAVEGALLEVLIAAGRLGTAVREGSQAKVARTAERVDVATGQLGPALEYLGLEKCANVVVQPQQSAN